MENELSKEFYKIKDVAEFVGVPQSTLRFWEREFPEYIKPIRNAGNIRYYRREDVEMLHMIRYLLHDRGMKIENTREELRMNRKNISRRMQILNTLTEVRGELTSLQKALSKRR